MNLPSYRPVTRTDVPAADPWLDDAVRPINKAIMDLTRALQYRGEEIVSFDAEHGKTYDITVNLQGQILGGICMYSAKPLVKPMTFTIPNDHQIRVVFDFGGDVGSVLVRLLVKGS